MVEFLIQFEKRDIKIARVNSILITKSINLQLFTLILYGVGVCCDRRRFSVLSPFLQKSMDLHTVYAYTNKIRKSTMQTNTNCIYPFNNLIGFFSFCFAVKTLYIVQMN